MQVKHIKCSQRVGSVTRLYDMAAYRQVYENGTGLTDTSISRRLPWYSLAQQDWIKADKASEFTGATYNQSTDTLREQRELGMKQYEMTDHLGNVLATVLDRKTGYGNSSGNYTGFSADVASITDYYPFGMPIAERSVIADNLSPFRYQYNGKEADNEIYGKDNSEDFGDRIYASRLGRFLSLDPETKRFPFYTPYLYAGNKPTVYIDQNGKRELYYALVRQVDAKGHAFLKVTFIRSEKEWTDYLGIDDDDVYLLGTNGREIRGLEWDSHQEMEDQINGLTEKQINELAEHKRIKDAMAMSIGAEQSMDMTSAAAQDATINGTNEDLNEEQTYTPNLKNTTNQNNTKNGATRAAQYSGGWENSSLNEAVNKFTPGAKGENTTSGKTIYKNSQTGIQVVYDNQGKYFRIQNTNLTGKRSYLDMEGNVPNNKIINGKTTGRNQAEYNQVTHFNNTDKQ